MNQRAGPSLRRICQLIAALPLIACPVHGLSGNLSRSLYPGLLPSSTTDIVDPAIDKSLIHTVSGYALQNVDICKSRPFAPTQENYITSGTDEWLRAYTLENMHRRYFKRHGLMATIAYDFLGDTNYKCAIGVQHSCAVQCTTVVGHIEDLRVARRVYFAMSSVAHFTSAVEIIHVSCPLPPAHTKPWSLVPSVKLSLCHTVTSPFDSAVDTDLHRMPW